MLEYLLAHLIFGLRVLALVAVNGTVTIDHETASTCA